MDLFERIEAAAAAVRAAGLKYPTLHLHGASQEEIDALCARGYVCTRSTMRLHENAWENYAVLFHAVDGVDIRVFGGTRDATAQEIADELAAELLRERARQAAAGGL